MISRRSLLLLAAAAAGALAAAPALAAERFDYTPGAFDAALSAGKPILVWIRASLAPDLQGPGVDGNRPLGRRHRSGFDRGAGRQGRMTERQ